MLPVLSHIFRFLPGARSLLQKLQKLRQFTQRWTVATGFLTLSLLLALAACGGGDSGTGLPTAPPEKPGTPPSNPPGTPPSNPPIAPDPQPSGILSIAASGLPAAVPMQVVVTGPAPSSNINRSTSAPVTWTDLPSGRYTVKVMNTRGTPGSFEGVPDQFDVSIPAAGAPVTATATYRPVPSALSIKVSGIPAGGSPTVSVTSPTGVARQITDSAFFAAAQLASGQNSPDRWRVSASRINLAGNRYSAQLTELDTTVAFGDTLRLNLRYQLASGSLAVAITGLPEGVAGDVMVIAPDRSTQSLSQTTTLTSLEPGRYRLIIQPVVHENVTWRPQTDTLDVNVDAAAVAAPATIVYQAQTGSLALSVSGLPAGSPAIIGLKGKGRLSGVERSISASTTLSNLPEGSYSLTAERVTSTSGDGYSASKPAQDLTISAGQTSQASVSYALATGSLSVQVLGLPSGVAAKVNVSGPDGYTRTLSAGTTLNGLDSGQYTVTAQNVVAGASTYGVSNPVRSVNVKTGTTPASVSLRYDPVPSVVEILVDGVPSGYPASISVSGPAGEHYVITSSQQLSAVAPGRWKLFASQIGTGSGVYLPTPTMLDQTVAAGDTLHWKVSYAKAGTPTTGLLAVAVIGLPAGTPGSVAISGPGGFSSTANTTYTFTGLVPGDYYVTAKPVTRGSSTYTPAPDSQKVTVVGSNTATPATVVYSKVQDPSDPPDTSHTNFRIDGLYLTQAVQRSDGSLPLVAGREALLRVFVVASAANSMRPDVVVKIYDNSLLLSTTTIPAPETSVRTTTAEGVLKSSWNMRVPAELMRTGLKVVAELDPDRTIIDPDLSDNVWPLGGSPRAITVQDVPAFRVRFVPIVTGSLTGNVSTANHAQFLNTAKLLWPLRDVNADVHEPFTTSVSSLMPNNENGGWLTVLQEMEALRTMEGVPYNLHYYGVVKVNYNSGIAGLGYVPGRSAIGWDYLPSGDEVAAHEWGHNFSRWHAPCGGAADVDPAFPNSGGTIGQWGWNSISNTLVAPSATDLMGYCNNTWISGYTWLGAMQYRSVSNMSAGSVLAGGSGSAAASSAGPARGEGLLVWGSVTNGRISLKPAFRVNAVATAASRRATHRLDLLDQSGATLLSLPIEASLVDHSDDRELRQFSVIVPWSASLESRLDRIRVSDLRSPVLSAVRSSARSRLALLRQGGGASQAASQAGTGQAATKAGSGGLSGIEGLQAGPQATLRAASGQIRVTWQNPTWEMAMVRDASSGQLLGFVQGQAGSVLTQGRRVEVVFSDGVRSEVQR